ncbi:hypothetical protein M427DRAFT_153345 [Gonapodya prolifera JEL478]|uniref:Thioesterase domain-containing protein n=1 Tax=Gonapodya prolifera (strain JEL478) TaxID=1344416 RepID=A0A139ANF4_GONPJ|nr:hypothetical protein M427DRAFT_153345 [Gonapodya prolifera JEL478]|eukprot:KXS18164.1 hypothetical protein M427DRAFT_153345 [Gonapodya prolifera JEL478]
MHHAAVVVSRNFPTSRRFPSLKSFYRSHAHPRASTNAPPALPSWITLHSGTWTPPNPAYKERIIKGMDKGFGANLGVNLVGCGPGWLELGFLSTERTSQPSGYVHGGAISALHDIANGKATYTLAPSSKVVLTVELKLNILRPTPCAGPRTLTLCRSQLVKPGRNIVVSRADCVYFKIRPREGTAASDGRREKEEEAMMREWDWDLFSDLVARTNTNSEEATVAVKELEEKYGVHMSGGILASTSLSTCMLVDGRETWANE